MTGYDLYRLWLFLAIAVVLFLILLNSGND